MQSYETKIVAQYLYTRNRSLGVSGPQSTVHIFTKDETRLVYLPTQLDRTLLVMVNVVKGRGRAPPTLTSLG
jgi:hypothetical protein